MKRTITTIVIILCIVLLSSCGKKEITGGKTALLLLEGNATTGYNWTYATSINDVIKVVNDEYIPNNTSEGMTGSGGTQNYKFEGGQEGEATLTFTYSRPWEKATEALYKLEYVLKVDEKLNITQIKKSGTYSSDILPDLVIE